MFLLLQNVHSNTIVDRTNTSDGAVLTTYYVRLIAIIGTRLLYQLFADIETKPRNNAL